MTTDTPMKYEWNENDVCVNPDDAFTLTYGSNIYDRAVVQMAQDEVGAWHYGIIYPNGGFLPHRSLAYSHAANDYNEVLDAGKEHMRNTFREQLEWCETNAQLRAKYDNEDKAAETHCIKMYRHFLNEMAQPTLF